MMVRWLMMAGVIMTSGIQCDANREAAVELAKAALRESLGLPEDAELHVRGVEPVDWPDGSLGCPKQGERYLMMVIPGFRVVLEAAGGIHKVHVGGGSAVVCADSTPAVPGAHRREPVEQPPPAIPEPTDPARARLVRQAREDLAERLSIGTDEIVLVEFSSVVWPDGSCGCPRPGMEYPQVQREGALLRLRVGEKLYQYHSDGGRMPFLCESPKK